MRAAIYARYSSDLSRDASIEDQVRLCRAYAVRAGWEVTQVFEDRAISGASTIRPGYQRLLEAVLAGSIDVVLAEALDRLSRDQEDIAALYKRLRFLGVQADHRQRGRDRRSAHRPQGRDERALPQGPRRQDPARPRGPRAGRPQRRRALLRLRRGARATSAAAAAIDPDEAAIVRRIFTEFAAGRSPKAIARGLNDENVPGPRGILWRDTAIRGHRPARHRHPQQRALHRPAGLEPAALRQGPATGRRVSRPNPPEAWVVEEVPELRIIDDALWERVKARQAEIDAKPEVQAIKASRFWEHRRATHLLTGLVRCSACGGGFAAVGRDYLACANARKFARCDQRKAHPPRGPRRGRARPRPRSPDAARRGQDVRRRLHARDQRRPGRCGGRTRPAAEAARHRRPQARGLLRCRRRRPADAGAARQDPVAGGGQVAARG